MKLAKTQLWNQLLQVSLEDFLFTATEAIKTGWFLCLWTEKRQENWCLKHSFHSTWLPGIMYPVKKTSVLFKYFLWQYYNSISDSVTQISSE